MVSFEIVAEGLDKLLAGLEAYEASLHESLGASIREAGDLVLEEARQHVNSQRVIESLHSDVRALGADFEDLVGSPVPLARWIEKGTPPHLIQAGVRTGRSSKQALDWPDAEHPTPYVHHPGTKARPFLEPALRNNVNRILGIFKTGVEGVLRKVKG